MSRYTKKERQQAADICTWFANCENNGNPWHVATHPDFDDYTGAFGLAVDAMCYVDDCKLGDDAWRAAYAEAAEILREGWEPS